MYFINRIPLVIFIFLCLGCSKNDSAISDENKNSTELEQFTLEVVANEGGTVSSSGGIYALGATINVIAVPDEGYNFISWSGDIDAFDSNVTLTMTQDFYIEANFELIVSSD